MEDMTVHAPLDDDMNLARRVRDAGSLRRSPGRPTVAYEDGPQLEAPRPPASVDTLVGPSGEQPGWEDLAHRTRQHLQDELGHAQAQHNEIDEAVMRLVVRRDAWARQCHALSVMVEGIDSAMAGAQDAAERVEKERGR